MDLVKELSHKTQHPPKQGAKPAQPGPAKASVLAKNQGTIAKGDLSDQRDTDGPLIMAVVWHVCDHADQGHPLTHVLDDLSGEEKRGTVRVPCDGSPENIVDQVKEVSFLTLNREHH